MVAIRKKKKTDPRSAEIPTIFRITETGVFALSWLIVNVENFQQTATALYDILTSPILDHRANV